MLEHLFQIDGIPLKFKICLSNKKLKRHLACLIKEHGGELSDKYSKDIFLLCPEDYILKTDNCYSYTFIYDSIEAQKLKNKEDYKIFNNEKSKTQKKKLNNSTCSSSTTTFDLNSDLTTSIQENTNSSSSSDESQYDYNIDDDKFEREMNEKLNNISDHSLRFTPDEMSESDESISLISPNLKISNKKFSNPENKITNYIKKKKKLDSNHEIHPVNIEFSSSDDDMNIKRKKNSHHQIISDTDSKSTGFMSDCETLTSSTEINEECNRKENVKFVPVTNKITRRIPKQFTLAEDMKILNYVIENKLFNQVKGKFIWKECEKHFKDRTFEVLESRFRKCILKKIETYPIDKKYRNIFINIRDSRPFIEKKEELLNELKNSNRRTRSKMYSPDEDYKIIKLICQDGNYKCAFSRTFWISLEKRKFLPDRTYHSLENHFRKYILNNIEKYDLTERERKILNSLKVN